MSTNQQPPQESTAGIEFTLWLLLIGLLLAWPALLLGVLARWLIKRHTTEQYPYWIGTAIGGAIGAFLLATRANPYPFFQAVLGDLVALVLHMSMTTFTRFLGDALPLWARSLFVFPWFVLVFELFSPRSLQASLLAQERQRRAIQIRNSQRAARKAATAPDQISGKAVLGALIDNPNE